MLLRAKRIVDREVSDPLIELSGSTLDVYLTLLYANRPLTIREIQRMIGFKSPNSVRHHLEKLISMGYVKRENLGYTAVKPSRSLLNALISIGRLIIPRQFFTWLTVLLISIFYLVVNSFNPMATIVLVAINIIVTYDFLDTYLKIRSIFSLRNRKKARR